ncbi:hypothetical protein HFD88_002411 [Aspergillus terreus]|nr:hypothetical protein HFD88_002411 [Aspergillus terreus]
MEQFTDIVEQHPDSIALVCTHQPPGLYDLPNAALEDTQPYLRWTYSTLGEAVKRLARGLALNGIVAGTPFFVLCQNQAEYIVAALAAYSMGLIHIPINPQNLSKVSEMQHMVDTAIAYQSAEQCVILAATDADARKVNEHLSLPADSLKILCDTRENQPGWVPLSSLLDANTNGDEPQCASTESEEISILFTSGTTSLPKGCPIKPARWLNNLQASLSLGSVSPSDRVAVPVPANHAFGFICTMLPLIRGACVVFSGAKFEPRATAEGLHREMCTHIAMVPAMVYGLEDALESSELTIESMRLAIFAGMTTTPEILKRCQSCLNGCQIENYYGMTEGAFLCTGATRDLGNIIQDENVAIGRPVCGSAVRICAPDEQCPLPVGESGELHYSGDSLISSYLNADGEEFYEANGKTWFRTGDRVFADEDGQIFFHGRYKDLIIRGGENISPAKIESVLSELPEFRSLHPQIIAAPDAIAGETPMAVVNAEISDDLITRMSTVIQSSLGVSHVPSSVVSLQSLGLSDYPKTALGKVQKSKLREIVTEYSHSRASGSGERPMSQSGVEHQLKKAWASVLGKKLDDIDVTVPVSQFADSIILQSVRGAVQRDTGRHVPLSRWLAASNIADQVQLLEASDPHGKELVTQTLTNKSHCLGADDMVHTGGSEHVAEATRTAIEKTIGKYNLTWTNVMAVTPCIDFIQTICRTQVVNTWNIRTLIITNNATAPELREAAVTTIKNNLLLLSFMIVDPELIDPELGLYAMIRPEAILDQCVLDYGAVDTLEDARKLNMDYPFPDHTLLPGPLFRALVVFVQESQSAALITNTSHSILDAVYHRYFHDCIDSALGRNPLPQSVSFNVWADSYHALRKSPSAETAVNVHVEYLHDIHEHVHALWPYPTHQLTVSPERADQDGHIVIFTAPSFVHLRERHPQVTAPVILKAALALLAISHTNHTHALFLNLEANRSTFPFLPSSLAAHTGLEAADVAGPTFSGVLNLIPFQPEQTVLDYLLHIQQVQAMLSAHANVPWYEVFRRLGLPAHEILPQVAESLIFNWMPGLGSAVFGENPFRNMKVAQTHIRTKLGLLASAGAGGPDGSNIVLFLQGAIANCSSVWVEKVAEDWKKIALWLAAEESWALPVARFADCLA